MLTTFTPSRRSREWFFDRPAVESRVDKARIRNLSRIGAFVRRRARSSLRRRKKVSAPGQPPSIHEQKSLKEIYFAYDPASDSVVIGPVGRSHAGGLLGPQLNELTVPEIHEFGGLVQIRERFRGDRWVSYGKVRPGQPTRTRQARYPQRAFMRPALDAELAAGTFSATFSGLVRG